MNRLKKNDRLHAFCAEKPVINWKDNGSQSPLPSFILTENGV